MAQELDQSAANYRYILRYLIDPHRDAGERLEELVGFCREARIDEVMLLLQAEELSAGHPTRREWADGIALARRMSDRLAQENIGLSINPWSTTYGVTRGRKLREGQNFQRMVGEKGWSIRSRPARSVRNGRHGWRSALPNWPAKCARWRSGWRTTGACTITVR